MCPSGTGAIRARTMTEVTPNLKQVMASSRSIWGRSPCSRLTERPLEASSAWTYPEEVERGGKEGEIGWGKVQGWGKRQGSGETEASVRPDLCFKKDQLQSRRDKITFLDMTMVLVKTSVRPPWLPPLPPPVPAPEPHP